ncbi:MAG: HrcA family transcriptional regulator, partial [Trichococcus sp.]
VKQTIKHGFQNPYREVQQVVEKSAEMLSFLTNYTALAIGPETKDSRLTGFRLVSLNEGHVMAILVTDKGHVENQIFSVSPPGFSASEIEKIVNIFNQELVGRTLQEVFIKLQTDIPVIIRKYVDAKIDFTAIFNDIVAKLEHDRFHVGGSMNLLNHLDATMDKNKVKAILNMLNGSPDIHALFSNPNDGVGVKIGTELNNELLHNFSLITATYDTAGNGKGLIALLGPTNMPYQKMISIMKFMRYELSDSLNDLNK